MSSHESRMRKMAAWGTVGSAALGGILGAVIATVAPNWVGATAIGLATLAGSAIIQSICLRDRRLRQIESPKLRLPAIPTQRGPRNSGDECN